MNDAGHSPSPDETPNLARLLLLGWRWFDDGLREGLRAAGYPEITPAQSMVFPFLDANGTRPGELAQRLGISRQAAHQLVAGLRKQGLVELRPDPVSARSKLVMLTAQGTASVAAALASLRDLEQTLKARIGEDHHAALVDALTSAWGDRPTG